MPLHYQHDFRPYLAYLRTPPLHFGRRPPQSNCPPCTVPDPDNGPRLEPQTNQGGISRMAPRDLATTLQSLPPILHRPVHSPAIRAGRNLPDKEFRYLRTVIVTAAVYRGFDQELAPHHLTFRHRAGVTPYTSTFVFAECCVFNKQSQPPILCDPIMLSAQALHTTGVVTVSICRVPSPEFSQAPWNIHPVHLCRFAVRSRTAEA